MAEGRIKFTMWQKFLLTIGFISLSIFIGVVFLQISFLIIISILHKLIPKNQDIYALGIAFPLIWAPFLSIIFGIIIGLILAISKIKKIEKQWLKK